MFPRPRILVLAATSVAVRALALAQLPAGAPTGAETTPAELPEATTFLYRADPAQPMRLFVVKPPGWKVGDHRAALLFFFGGGWTKGTPEKSIAWARLAARLGLIGIAPDYRTHNRHGTSPLASVADGRGTSAGGHVALWTALTRSPPGSSEAEAPLLKPGALILFSAVSDTSLLSGYTPRRFGENAIALSPVHQLDAKMPRCSRSTAMPTRSSPSRRPSPCATNSLRRATSVSCTSFPEADIISVATCRSGRSNRAGWCASFCNKPGWGARTADAPPSSRHAW